MANSGGGVIVYGVDEVDKAATGRVDENKCDESYERTLRAVACSAIMPPVFNLGVRILGSEGRRAVVVEVPASVEALLDEALRVQLEHFWDDSEGLVVEKWDRAWAEPDLRVKLSESVIKTITGAIADAGFMGAQGKTRAK